MVNIFNQDGGFSKFMNKIADLFILNILRIFCSIPIITIGATTTALYSVNLKLVNNEEGSLIKLFFKSFKENFKKVLTESDFCDILIKLSRKSVGSLISRCGSAW